MIGGPAETAYNEVCFPVHEGWDSRDVSVIGVFDCIKECMSSVM